MESIKNFFREIDLFDFTSFLACGLFKKDKIKRMNDLIIDCKHHHLKRGGNDLNFVSKSSKLSLFGSFRSILCSTIVIILHQMCSSFANFKERQSFGCVHLTTPFSQIVLRWTFHFQHMVMLSKSLHSAFYYDMNNVYISKNSG